jgi:hypothetical protein
VRSITSGLSIIRRLGDVRVDFGLGLRSRRSYLGSMEVHDFPTRPGFSQHDSSSIEKSGPVVQMECRNRKIAEHLKLHILWLNIHIRAAVFPLRICWKTTLKVFPARLFARSGNARG